MSLQTATRATLTTSFAPLLTSLLVIVFYVILNQPAIAGDSGWSLGARAGADVYFSDFNVRKVGPGIEALARYQLSPHLSLGATLGFEVLKTHIDPNTSSLPYDYVRLQGVPLTLGAWFHFLHGEHIAPYLYAGVGGMLFQRLDWRGQGIPNSGLNSSIHIPLGAGLQIPAWDRSSVEIDLGYRILADGSETLQGGGPDGYATVKVGITFAIGGTPAEPIRTVTPAPQPAPAAIKFHETPRQPEAPPNPLVPVPAGPDERAISPLPSNTSDRVVRSIPRSPDRGSFLGEGVRFAPGSANISAESEEVLENIFLKLILMANDVEVIGYTDSTGDPGGNLRLSLARAEAVKRWLLAKGMPKHRITAVGRGSADPIAPNDTLRGRGQNRRIEVHIIPTGRNPR